MSKVIVLIPTRMGSTRLPNKPLKDVNGKTMIHRIYENVTTMTNFPAYVAAGNQEIIDEIEKIGGKAILTDPNLPSGSDRIAAALKTIDPTGEKYDIVVSFQGDAINTHPRIITELVELLEKSGADITTPVMTMAKENYDDPGAVKTAVGFKDGQDTARALYFSRASIPFDREGKRGTLYHHIGIYVYKRQALLDFVSQPEGMLERREKLEQLRALEMGKTIFVKKIDSLKIINEAPADIDTPEELEACRKYIK
ncbi:MAG: 3-deoxy-manno-octulosonate cytidylyltransferase [Alphaproteobacteria bacterium]|nr:3-deoxy-manno-octulosonate cytidylyltransferase [Alphaproteobacteria bacterium]